MKEPTVPPPRGALSAPLPTFAAPIQDPTPEEPETAPSPPQEAPEPPRRRPLGERLTQSRLHPRPDTPATGNGHTPAGPVPATDASTGTSAYPSKPTTAETAKLVAGLLALAFSGAALVVQYSRRRRLRKPTRDQYDGMARPLAKIGLRHVDPGVINADLVDLIAFGVAAGDYVSDGPLTTAGPAIDAGVPTNLQEEPQS